MKPLLLFALIAAIPVGCSGKIATLPDAAPPTTIQGACATQATAECNVRDTCTGGIGTQIDYGNNATCTSLLTQSCVLGFGAPDTATTVPHVDGCAAAYASQSCIDWDDDNPPAACHSATGTRSNGAACGENSQCSSGFCLVGENSECGTCQPFPQPGAPCQSESTCGYGLACTFYLPATSGVCTVRGGMGASCDDLHLCQGGLGCVGADSATGVLGSCQTAATTVGASCNNQKGPPCDGSYFLECLGGTCQTQPLVSAGAACGSQPSGPYNRCTGGAPCVTPLGPCQHDTGASCGTTTGGVCVAPAANGSACDIVKGPLCLNPARCIVTSDGGTEGTCTFPDPASCG